MSTPNLTTSYSPPRGIPALAGIATFEQAEKPGLSVENCVNRLKRLHWAFRRIHQILVHRLVSEPVYELKMGFSLHAHYCAEHAAAFRKRIAEMREPPLGLDVIPDAALDIFFDEILSAPDSPSLLIGIYGEALPALERALAHYIETTHPLVDHPSIRVCKFAMMEAREMLAYGQAVLSNLDYLHTDDSAQWRANLCTLLGLAGGLDGHLPKPAGTPHRLSSAAPYTFDPEPKRDPRFTDPYNMGVHAEAFLYDPEMPVNAKPLMMFYKRLREIDVPEVIASILAETKDKPWEYTVDMTRQMWDEARHAMMGEVGFLQAGIDWREKVRINFTWSLALNTQLKPIERHAVLYFIEQGLMPKTGKRFEWEVGIASGNEFSALAQDFDWADEVLHARIGRDWYVKAIGDSKSATAYGDECWSRVLIDWEKYKAQGLTSHENWWQRLYSDWCDARQIEPHPKALSFDTSYAAKRADLRDLSASA
jgi:hypothetical protein